jgi:hypothetical protein
MGPDGVVLDSGPTGKPQGENQTRHAWSEPDP